MIQNSLEKLGEIQFITKQGKKNLIYVSTKTAIHHIIRAHFKVYIQAILLHQLGNKH